MAISFQKLLENALQKDFERKLDSSIAFIACWRSMNKHKDNIETKITKDLRVYVKTPDGAWILS